MTDEDGRHVAEIELPDDGEAERVGRELMIGQLMGMVNRDQAGEVRVEVKRVVWTSEEVREKAFRSGI